MGVLYQVVQKICKNYMKLGVKQNFCQHRELRQDYFLSVPEPDPQRPLHRWSLDQPFSQRTVSTRFQNKNVGSKRDSLHTEVQIGSQQIKAPVGLISNRISTFNSSVFVSGYCLASCGRWVSLNCLQCCPVPFLEWYSTV